MIGWIIGGVAAVLILLAGIGGVILIAGQGDSDSEAGPGDGSHTTSETRTTESPSPSESPTPSQSPTEVVNDYYDALVAHDVDGAYETLCAAYQGSEEDFFGSYTEEEFWEIVDNSVYTVGDETKNGEEDVTVDIHQEIQGTEYDFSADLLIESGEWKICYWSEPVQA